MVYDLIEKLDKIIDKNGLANKIKKFKKNRGFYLHNISYIMNTAPKKNEDYLQYYIKAYDKNAHINKKNQIKQFKYDPNKQKIPEIKNQKDILTVKWFFYQNYMRGNWEKRQAIFIKKSSKLINNALRKNPKKIVIDLRDYMSNNLWTAILSMEKIYGNTTLFAFGKEKILQKSNDWFNLEDGKKYIGKFKEKKLAFDKPIEILIGENTNNTGLLLAATFFGRENVVIKGKNNHVPFVIKKFEIDQEFELALPYLITTVDGKLHKKKI